MSAPAGWYPQPDGRQRYWDGSQWTEHFHDAQPDAAAAPEGTSSPVGADAPQPTYGQAYGQPAQGATPAYGAPPAGTSSSSGMGKGCLIAAIIAVVVVALVVVIGIFAFRKAADEVKTGLDKIASSQAIPMPDGSASDGSSGSAPVDGESVEIGKAFTVSGVKVAEGWKLTKQEGLGFWIFAPTLAEPLAKDTILDVSARNGSSEIDSTICTGSKGESKLNCLPFTEDVSGATSLVIGSAF